MTNQYVNLNNISIKTKKWMDKIDKETKIRKNFIFDPLKSAFLIIDLQNYFTDKNSFNFLPASKVTVPNIKLIYDYYFKNNLFVISTLHINNEKNLALMGKFYNNYIKNDDLTLDVKDYSKIITKHSYDAFFETNLENILKEKKIEQVLISGCMTNLCCESTARTAFIKGYEVYFLVDATFTKNESLHFGSLKNIAEGFGRIIKTSEVINCLKKL